MLTILYASTMGVREPHFKRRLAYSTVSNLSYVLLGVTMMSPLGLLAGLAHMLFHAVMKIGGFFCVGAVMHQTGKNYVYELDGLGRHMPYTFSTLLVFSLSLAGLPLFSGFISKWQIAKALFANGTWIAKGGVAVLLYSALMTAIYLLTIIVRAFFPERPGAVSAQENFTDPGWQMLFPLGILSVVTIAFGVCAGPVLSLLWRIAQGVF